MNDNGNVIDFPGLTMADIDPDKVLNSAVGKLETVLVIGWDKNGEMHFASSKSDGRDALWLIEQTKLALLNAREED